MLSHPLKIKQMKTKLTHNLHEAGNGIKKQARAGSQMLEVYVKDHPKKSLGLSMGFALLVGTVLTFFMKH